MSGYLGLVQRDGAPVEPRSVRRMAAGLAGRSPGGLAAWRRGAAGLVQSSPGPRTLDGRYWFVGDVRLAGRGELTDRLRREAPAAPGADDPDLVLHAWRALGPDCTDALLGDFSFAVWDAHEQVLFAARDPLGVTPFFYATPPGALVFGNTLGALRLHPGVSGRLDERFLGDYLLFGGAVETDYTAFADVQRLPAGHALRLSAREGVRVTRYWEAPAEGELRLSGPAEYVECFRERFGAAVSDCVGEGPVGVMMSGGVDSTLVAAVAAERAGAGRVRGHLIAHARLFADAEREPARRTADHVGIALHEHLADGYGLMEGLDDPASTTPEPTTEPLLAMTADLYRTMEAHAGTALTGFDGDALLSFAYDRHLAALARSFRFGRIVREAAWILGQRPIARVGLRSALRRRRRRRSADDAVPPWLEPRFAARAGLADRWRQVQDAPPKAACGRAPAHRYLADPVFPYLFESYDPAWTGTGLRFRHPFMDLRVVSFLLALPPVPWCVDKHLFREAARGLLPEPVRTRPKTPLPVDLAAVRVRSGGMDSISSHRPAPELGKYVSWSAVRNLDIAGDVDILWSFLRVVGLSGWLRHREVLAGFGDPPLTWTSGDNDAAQQEAFH